MKHLLIAGALALSFVTPVIPAFSADQSDSATTADEAAALQKMQDQMQKMQDEMARIQSTKSPAERRKLMHQHWQSMMQGMTMMNQCCGGQMMMGMMGHMGGQGAGGMHGGMGTMSPQMMQNRMDLMQMMMDQIMQHQHMMQQSK